MRKFLLAAAMILSSATVAHAATFAGSTAGPDSSPPSGLLTIDFNSGSQLSDIAGLSGNGQLVTGFKSGEYAAPWQDQTQYLSVPKTGGSGQVVLDLTGYDFGGTVDGFSFYWGSIDKYNSLKIDTSNGTTWFAFDGVNPNPPPANGDQLTSANNRRVYFSLGQGETLNSLTFKSDGYAFELDDIVFTGNAVPEPATWAMMLIGFGGIGVAMRSARRKQAVRPANA